MAKMVFSMVIAAMLLGGCVVSHSGKVKKAPPGQVQKATGYNPASGKIKR